MGRSPAVSASLGHARSAMNDLWCAISSTISRLPHERVPRGDAALGNPADSSAGFAIPSLLQWLAGGCRGRGGQALTAHRGA